MPSIQDRLLRIVAITVALFILSQVPLSVTLGAAPERGSPFRASGSSPDAVNVAEESEGVDVQGFHLVSADEGWLLLNQQLYWTASGGQTWKVITPSNLGSSGLRAAFFLDTRRGWLVSTNLSGDPSTGSGQVFTLSRTLDAGATWQTRPLALFEASESALAAAVYLHWIDAQTGWLVVRRATSSSFSIGALFKTTDGGDSWTRLTLPIGEPVYFATDEMGWTAGGAAGNQLYRTRDGGRTWVQQSVGAQHAVPLPPKFENPRDGVLPVVVTSGNESRLELYRTRDGGESWTPASRLPLGREIAPGTRPPIAILDADQSIIILPRDELTEGIRELDMATPRVGWAKYASGNCASNRDKTSIRCSQTTRLLRTTDGGQTWQPLALPGSAPNTVTITRSSNQPLAATSTFTYTQTVAGQGFDACGLPSTNQFQTWWRFSPYMAYNLYIGGAAMASCTPLSAPLVSELASQGWKFFPTWVGPQAPCSIYIPKFSSDTATAYNQGVTEANSALDAAYNLGLTDASESGTIIYYDMEGYDPNNTACRNAVNSFVSGWSYQLKSRGNVAGAYGGCSSDISSWAWPADPRYIPDVVWLAHWLLPYQYRADASVWDPACIDNTLWVNHQRLRQYAGPNDETWGGVTRKIDSDVLDGVVVSLSNVVKPLYRYYFPFVSK